MPGDKRVVSLGKDSYMDITAGCVCDMCQCHSPDSHMCQCHSPRGH